MNIPRAKKIAKLIRRSAPWIDGLGLLLVALFYLNAVPFSEMGPGPATGGDMGSHFWPVYALFHHGFSAGTLRVWSPGNLGGEPLLVHYFPFPFILMAIGGFFTSLGNAFNWGTIFPVFAFPFVIYFVIRLFGFRFPAPLLAVAATLPFLYNESFSMWGGNILSTLAGQFAHLYALEFLLLGLGSMVFEVRHRKLPIFSTLFFAALLLSHAYVFLGLPFFFLSVLFFVREMNWRWRFAYLFVSGIWAILLSAWFVLPMVDNAKWTTPFAMSWISSNIWREVAPPIFYPIIAALALAVILFVAVPKLRSRWRYAFRVFVFWLLPSLAYVGFYFVFFKLGLVNVRAVPQIELFLSILAGILVAVIFNRLGGRVLGWLFALPLVLVSLAWVGTHSPNYRSWMRWNYSGWERKVAYPSLKHLYTSLHGDFSQPRVLYEHNMSNNAAGTERVFEMLPYFANRSTLESVYMQANILAPMDYFMQAITSKTPSCPYSEYRCPHYDLHHALPKLHLMAVGDLILTTPELIAEAESEKSLYSEAGTFGQWRLYHLVTQPRYAEVFTRAPEQPKKADWKREFFDWFDHFDGSQNFLAFVPDKKGKALPEPSSAVWQGTSDCKPEVSVAFNELVLKTPCPGKAHFLKFAYHSSWKADSGDSLFLVSPGFIGIVPSKPVVTLRFGQSISWKIATWISLLTLILFPVVLVSFGKKLERRTHESEMV